MRIERQTNVVVEQFGDIAHAFTTLIGFDPARRRALVLGLALSRVHTSGCAEPGRMRDRQ